MPLLLRILLAGLVLTAAVYDIRFRRIPNWLNLSGLIVGLGLNTLLFAHHGLAAASLGLICSLAVYVPLYLIRGMGAGDVKLMAAVGTIAGPHDWLMIFLSTAIIGGVISILVVLAKKRFGQTAINLSIVLSELTHFRLPAKRQPGLDVRNSQALRMPHAVSIALGSLAFLSFVALQ